MAIKHTPTGSCILPGCDKPVTAPSLLYCCYAHRKAMWQTEHREAYRESHKRCVERKRCKQKPKSELRFTAIKISDAQIDANIERIVASARENGTSGWAQLAPA